MEEDTSEKVEDVLKQAEQAESKSQEFSKAQKQIRQVKNQLREQVDHIYNKEEAISEEQFDHLNDLIDRGKYAKVREKLKEYTSKTEVEFSDQEKQDIADAYGEAMEEVNATIEHIRNSLLQLKDSGYDRETLINILYGENAANKGTLREVFDVLDRIDEPLSDRDKARVISAFSTDLNITDTEKVVEAIEQRSK